MYSVLLIASHPILTISSIIDLILLKGWHVSWLGHKSVEKLLFVLNWNLSPSIFPCLIVPSQKKQHQYTLCFLPRNSPYWMPAFNFLFPFKATCYKILIKSNQNSSHLNLKTLKIFCFLSILVSDIKSICSLGKPGMSLSHFRDQALVGQLRFLPAQGRPCPRQSLTCLLFGTTDEPHSGLCLTSPALLYGQSSTEETWCFPSTILYVPTLITSLNPKLLLSFPISPPSIFCFPFHQMFGYISFRNVLLSPVYFLLLSFCFLSTVLPCVL